MSHDVLHRLREATRPAHERLESRMAVFEAMAARGAARGLARRYYAFHASSEMALQDALQAVDGLEFDRRRRAPRIAAALEGLGEAPPSARAPALPASVPEALGFMYVLEGSSLGGRVIRREAARRGIDFTGLDFLDPYAGRTGEMWRRFLRVLERHCPAGDDEAGARAVAGAVTGFAHAEATLCASGAPA